MASGSDAPLSPAKESKSESDTLLETDAGALEAMVVLIARLERRWQLSRRRTEREQGSGPRGGLSFARGQRRQAPARASCWCSMGSICLGPNLRRSLKLTEPEGGATAATTFEVRTAW